VDLQLWNNDGNTLLGLVSSTTNNQWETLTLRVTNAIPTEFVLYASGGPALFYADNASVVVPEPSYAILFLLGTAAITLHRRRSIR
jgi:hypothetical protein